MTDMDIEFEFLNSLRIYDNYESTCKSLTQEQVDFLNKLLDPYTDTPHSYDEAFTNIVGLAASCHDLNAPMKDMSQGIRLSFYF